MQPQSYSLDVLITCLIFQKITSNIERRLRITSNNEIRINGQVYPFLKRVETLITCPQGPMRKPEIRKNVQPIRTVFLPSHLRCDYLSRMIQLGDKIEYRLVSSTDVEELSIVILQFINHKDGVISSLHMSDGSVITNT